MSEGEVPEPQRGGAAREADHPLSASATPPQQVTFNREELRVLFDLYGRKVAAGEWRDYAIDFRRDEAIFSIFRRTAEFPLYRVEKNPKLARRQGAYSVVAPGGHIMKRGTDLAQVLRILDKPVRLVEA